MEQGDSKLKKGKDKGKVPESKMAEAAGKVSRGLLSGDPTYWPKRTKVYGNELDSDDGKRHLVGLQETKTLRQNAKDSETSVVNATKLRDSLKELWGEEAMKAIGEVDYNNAIDSVTRNARVAEDHAAKYRSRGDSTKMVERFKQDRKALEAISADFMQISRDLTRAIEARRDTFEGNSSPQAVIEGVIRGQRTVIQLYRAAFRDSTRQDIKSTFGSAGELLKRDNTCYELLQVTKTFRDFMKQNPEKLASELEKLVNKAVNVSERARQCYKDYMIEDISKSLGKMIGEHDTRKTKAQDLLGLGLETPEELDQKITVFEELELANNTLYRFCKQLTGKDVSRRHPKDGPSPMATIPKQDNEIRPATPKPY